MIDCGCFQVNPSEKSLLETIAITKPGNNLLPVFPDFFSQTGDIHIYSPVQHDYLIRPYPGEYFFPGKNTVFVFEQQFEYLKFLFGE